MIYEMTWRNKFLTIDADSIDDMIEDLQSAVYKLEAMKKAGVKLDPDSNTEFDFAHLVTEDASVAKQFGFEEKKIEEDSENFGQTKD